MYRAYDAKDERLSNSRSVQNCKAWQGITSKDIPIEDIREVVYKYDIDKISRLMTDVGDSNGFAMWIRKNNDVEVQRFLRLAKSCEEVRFMKSSRWYYPSKEDDILLNLEAIRDKALGYDGERLRDRYALQALRAMHSLGEFADIDKWWDENGGRIRSGVIREMAEEYVAGAISRLGNTDKAMEMAARSNDIGAIKGTMRYMGQDTDDKSVLDFIATHCPDNPNAPAFMQEIFYGAETSMSGPGLENMSLSIRISANLSNHVSRLSNLLYARSLRCGTIQRRILRICRGRQRMHTDMSSWLRILGERRL